MVALGVGWSGVGGAKGVGVLFPSPSPSHPGSAPALDTPAVFVKVPVPGPHWEDVDFELMTPQPVLRQGYRTRSHQTAPYSHQTAPTVTQQHPIKFLSKNML